MGDAVDLDLNILDRFPAGLRPLLDRTVATIPERHRRNAYLVFAIRPVMERLIIACSVVALSFIHEYCKNPQFASTLTPLKWQLEIMVDANTVINSDDERVDKAKTQLRTWCRGLVEVLIVHPGASARSTWGLGTGISYPSRMLLHQTYFSHRTVSEYFQDAVVQDVLLKGGVTRDTTQDAISQMLLAEFCHCGPLSRICHRGWMKQLLLLRQTFFGRSAVCVLGTPAKCHDPQASGIAVHPCRTEGKAAPGAESQQGPRFVSNRGEIIDIGTIAMSEVPGMPWWSDKVKLWGPFFTAIRCGKYEYPSWKLQTDHNFNPDLLSIAATVYLAFGASHVSPSRYGKETGLDPTDQQHCDFLEQVFTKYRKHLFNNTTFVPRPTYTNPWKRKFRDERSTNTVTPEECLTIWEHYIMWQFGGTISDHVSTLSDKDSILISKEGARKLSVAVGTSHSSGCFLSRRKEAALE
ncbi:hypothetical protein QC762_511908 [Podospora pseudocomata]|uniref:Uncharacterized protein n=1 Tax=Podospora pseudocomata TaxID=2093779 RepID=A0ABR0GC09_9PEZI|nr:hypothetical protein QC762_511908 [Podospora pseudocomata]